MFGERGQSPVGSLTAGRCHRVGIAPVAPTPPQSQQPRVKTPHRRPRPCFYGVCVSPGQQGHTWGPWGLSPQPSRGGGSVGVLPPQGASFWARILFLWGNIGIGIGTSRQGIALFGLTGCHGPAHGLGICRRPARAAPLPQGGRHEGNGALWDMGTCVGTGPCVGNGAVWDMGNMKGDRALCGV